MSNPFEYRKPTAEQAEQMAELSKLFEAAYVFMAGMDCRSDTLGSSVTHRIRPSAERTLAIRKLQEARMWANVAILGITL
jgi:hypothetical protein